jgi:hypothetical protein
MEDIKAQPHAVLAELCAFLGVKDREFRKAGTPHHVGDEKPLPEDVKAILKKRLRPIYDELVELFPDRAAAWMARYY